jgi:menaquinone-dependent protoporphyrinogen IX oxidase
MTNLDTMKAARVVQAQAVYLHQINLADPVEREHYSHQLKEFESQFSYPLNVQAGSYFTIVHGNDSNNDNDSHNHQNSAEMPQTDYFSFFEQMGEAHYFVALTSQSQSNYNDGNNDNDSYSPNHKNVEIIGAGCAILISPDNHPPYWYLCDFKISKPWRQKGILFKILVKYLLPKIIKSHRFVAINMSNRKLGSGENTQSLMAQNGLLKKLKKLFFFLPVKMKMINLHQCTKNTLPENLKHNAIYSNHGKKDFILYENQEDKMGNPWDVYHLVNTHENKKDKNDKENHKTDQFQKFIKKDHHQIADTATILYVVDNTKDNNPQQSLNSQAVIVSSGVSDEILDNLASMQI